MADDIECPSCGAAIKSGSRFCEACGVELAHKDRSTVDDVASEIERELEEELSSGEYDLESAGQELERELSQAEREMDEAHVMVSSPPAGRPPALDSPAITPLRPATLDVSTVGSLCFPPFERVDSKRVQVRLSSRSVVNLASACAGTPIVDWLEVENLTHENSDNVLLRIWLAAGYGEPWEKSVPSIRAFDRYRFDSVDLPLSRERMREVVEAEDAILRFEILIDGEKVYSDSRRVTVHAFNEWFIERDCFPDGAESLAVFVTPNSKAVDDVLGAAKPILEKSTGNPSFDGYQSGSGDRALSVVRALYAALGDELKITYAVPPASFEPTGQKIRRPEDVLRNERGTCLDLAVLYAACIEAAGLSPVVFLMAGHAFLGCWLVPVNGVPPRVDDARIHAGAIEDGAFVSLNSTTFATGGSFEMCSEQGAELLRSRKFQCGVEVAACRSAGIKPLSWGDR